MPSEMDAITAVRNRLLIRRDRHLKLANTFDEQIKNLDKLRAVLSDNSDDLDLLASAEGLPSTEQAEGHRVPITRLIHRFITETGKTEFQAAEPYNFIKANGFPSVVYGSVYETLTRQVKAGKLSKSEDDPNFKVITKTKGG